MSASAATAISRIPAGSPPREPEPGQSSHYAGPPVVAGWAGHAPISRLLGPLAAQLPGLQRPVQSDLRQRIWLDPAPGSEAFGWSAELREPYLRDYPALPSLASLAAQPSPPAAVGSGASPPSEGPVEQKRPKRWSGDAWALLRRGGGHPLASAGSPATYGASQSGAVFRYRIDEHSPYRPTAYLRTTSTLGQSPETTAALGFSMRPLPSIPVIAAVEARIVHHAGKQRYQPATMVVTELPPFELPRGLRGEVYGQAGYVGGQFSTLFADGQVRVDQPLFDLGPAQARLGTAAWGGIQKGAHRLDVGPSATIAMPLGRGTFGRIALDWRFRTLGNAQPRSGPALTLSAGF